MGSSPSDQKHAQIMGALNLLGDKLVKSELEREELKQVIRDTVDEAEDVRTLLEKSEISRIRQQESMLGMLEEALSEQEIIRTKIEQTEFPDLSEFKSSQEKLKILIARNQKEMDELRAKQK